MFLECENQNKSSRSAPRVVVGVLDRLWATIAVAPLIALIPEHLSDRPYCEPQRRLSQSALTESRAQRLRLLVFCGEQVSQASAKRPKNYKFHLVPLPKGVVGVFARL